MNETLELNPGDTKDFDLKGTVAITVELTNDSAESPTSYDAKLGALVEQGTIGAAEKAQIGRWSVNGEKLSIKNTSTRDHGAKISRILLGGKFLPIGHSAQFDTIVNKETKLTVFNNSAIHAAEALVWCGYEGAKSERHSIPANGTFTGQFDCKGKFINISNITVGGQGSNITVVAEPA